jgi:hypothetical protein
LANAKEVLQRSPIISTRQEKKLIEVKADEKTKRYMATPYPQGLLPCGM